jgi:hypothetical protein
VAAATRDAAATRRDWGRPGLEAVHGVGEHHHGGRQRRECDQDVAHVSTLSRFPEGIYGRGHALDEGWRPLAVRLVGFLDLAGDGAGRAADRRADRAGDNRAGDGARAGFLFGRGAARAERHEGASEDEQAE